MRKLIFEQYGLAAILVVMAMAWQGALNTGYGQTPAPATPVVATNTPPPAPAPAPVTPAPVVATNTPPPTVATNIPPAVASTNTPAPAVAPAPATNAPPAVVPAPATNAVAVATTNAPPVAAATTNAISTVSTNNPAPAVALPVTVAPPKEAEAIPTNSPSIVTNLTTTPIVAMTNLTTTDVIRQAGKGDPEAQCELGKRFYFGQGLRRNTKEAGNWFLKSARQGNPEAQYLLAGMYQSGEFFKINREEALFWFQISAGQNYLEAQYKLGAMYAMGQFIPKKATDGALWCRVAAERGMAEAQVRLGELYANGQGVPQNEKEAIRWFRESAAQGNARAQFHLGNRYDTGRGVKQNQVEAYKWLNLSAAQGHTLAINARDKISRKMSAEQIRQGQRRSAMFTPVLAPNTNEGTIDAEGPVEAMGTGFFITEDGYLVTNHHLLVDAQQVVVKTSKGLQAATIVKSDPNNDLAILKVKGQFKALPLNSTSGVKIGDPIFTVGFTVYQPTLWTPKMSDGNIKNLVGNQDDPRFFQINNVLQQGNSGGPLVTSTGGIIGVVTLPPEVKKTRLNEEGSLFKNAIKSAYIEAMLESIPELAGKIKEPPPTKDKKFEDSVREAQDAVAQIIIY